MLPLPIFQYHRPKTLNELLRLTDQLQGSVKLMAGGTDLLPNIKHEITTVDHIISIRGVDEIRGISWTEQGLQIGAGTTLQEIADHQMVRRKFQALAEAAQAVGAPQHRSMGTLGGNLCLDTRCHYINQTYFWRQALGFCLKKDGTVCHVVQGGSKCVAAASNDTASACIVLGARVQIASSDASRVVSADEFYVADGIKNTILKPNEVVTHVLFSESTLRRRSAFEKLRRRGAIDFPLLSVAAMSECDENENVVNIVVCVSALGAKPRKLKKTADVLSLPKVQMASALAEVATKECKPLSNIDEDVGWRRQMVREYVERAVSRVL